MPKLHPLSSDAGNNFEDLSGINSAAFPNPYDALIEACDDDPESSPEGIYMLYTTRKRMTELSQKQIQSRYSTHCTARNAQQKVNFLEANFDGLNLDSILQRLEDPTIEPGFVDPRHSLVLWARPPAHTQELVSQIQQRMKKLAPNFWLMPVPNLHMTALEITHSVTAPEVAELLDKLAPRVTEMADLAFTRRPRLIKPLVSYDRSALALSFVPAAGEGLPSDSEFISPRKSPETVLSYSKSPQHSRTATDDEYTYHHLRRELYAMAHAAGVATESRYVVPSAHITIGRFIVQNDHDSRQKREKWIEEIEHINAWLQREFWPQAKEGAGNETHDPNKLINGQWIVGEGKGLDLRKGILWYGGGETVRLGKGF